MGLQIGAITLKNSMKSPFLTNEVPAEGAQELLKKKGVMNVFYHPCVHIYKAWIVYLVQRMKEAQEMMYTYKTGNWV